MFITNEQLQYLNNKFVNNSFKDFIITTLNISDLSTLFEEYNFDGNDFSEIIAMNKEDFKFFVGSIDEDNQVGSGMILDDFDTRFLSELESMGYSFLTIFNNNETRKIFNPYIDVDSTVLVGLQLDAEKSTNKKLNFTLNDENYITYNKNGLE